MLRGDTAPRQSAGKQLLKAVGREDLDLVRKLLESRADPNATDEHGETPLFEAAATGNLDIVATLLIRGADPHRKSQDHMVARDLTANVHVLSLFDLFKSTGMVNNSEADASLSEETLAEMEPKTAQELQDFLAAWTAAPRKPRGGLRDLMNADPAQRQKSSIQKDGFGLQAQLGNLDTRMINHGVFGNIDKETQTLNEALLEQHNQQKETDQRLEDALASLGVVGETDILVQSKHLFEVVKAKRCKVYAEANLDSAVLTKKSRGALLFGIELTMDGWLRLHERMGGWMMSDMYGQDGFNEVVFPKGRQPELVVTEKRRQGISCLEVLASEVKVYSVPWFQATVRSTRKQGEWLFARSQSLNGWVRLTNGEGWVFGLGGRGSPPLKCMDNELGTEEVDLVVISDIWSAVRKESRGALTGRTINALKKLQDDAVQIMNAKFCRCAPGSTDSYEALGLTKEEMKFRPRIFISHRVFRLTILEQLREKDLLMDFGNLSLQPYRCPMRAVGGLLEIRNKEGQIRFYDLGPDRTVYDQETHAVIGIWISNKNQVESMTHMCGLFSPADVPQPTVGIEPDEDQETDDVDSSPEVVQHGNDPVGPSDTSATKMLQVGRDMMDAEHWHEALSALEYASQCCESEATTDAGLEKDILMCRALTWFKLEDYEMALIDLDHIMAMENDLPPAFRHYYHTGVATEEVQQLRAAVFKARRDSSHGKEECLNTPAPGTFSKKKRALKRSQEPPSLGDID